MQKFVPPSGDAYALMREGFERVGLLAVILVPIIGAERQHATSMIGQFGADHGRSNPAANDVPETALGVIGALQTPSGLPR